MATQEIRNSNGKLLGKIVDEYPGQTAWNANGKKVGTWNSSNNTSHDASSGKKIAEGNILSGLIYGAA